MSKPTVAVQMVTIRRLCGASSSRVLCELFSVGRGRALRPRSAADCSGVSPRKFRQPLRKVRLRLSPNNIVTTAVRAAAGSRGALSARQHPVAPLPVSDPTTQTGSTRTFQMRKRGPKGQVAASQPAQVGRGGTWGAEQGQCGPWTPRRAVRFTYLFFISL